MKKIIVTFSFVCISLILSSCGSGSSSVPTASDEETVAAIANLMSSFGGTNQSISKVKNQSLVKFTIDASQEVCNNLGRGPHKVLMTGRGNQSGYYGSYLDYVNIDAETDLCQDSSGNDNSGNASIGGPLFANFMLAGEITGSCNGGSIELTRGNGITRNVESNGSLQTQIYGRFEANGSIINCTFYLNASGVLDSALSTCTDDQGGEISLASNSNCTLSGDVSRIALPSTIEGHYAINNDQGESVSYNCHNFRSMSVDSNNLITITNDCTDFAAYGFNLDSFSIGYVVSGDENSWNIYRISSDDDIFNRIKLMRIEGYPILAAIDMLYVANFDPADPSSVQDGEAFPEALIENTTFQQDLAEEISEVASLLESLNVEVFSPLSEPDRVFGSASAASTFLQNLMTPLNTLYTGAYMWIGFSTDETLSNYNLTGFDYAAINISPMPSHVSLTQFQQFVNDTLSDLSTLAGNYGIPFLISNAGIWGESIGNAYDWGAQSHALEAFQTMNEESVSAGTAGIIFWEGTTGEVVFEDYDDVAGYIMDQFN